jgi:hypothetical protein
MNIKELGNYIYQKLSIALIWINNNYSKVLLGKDLVKLLEDDEVNN